MDPPHSVRPFLRVRATPLSGISFWAMQSLILLLLLAVPLNAHNGAVAIAVPVEGIVVDGDLSDWPEEFRDDRSEPVELSGAAADKARFDAYGERTRLTCPHICIHIQS